MSTIYTGHIPLCEAHRHLRNLSAQVPRERREAMQRATAWDCSDCRMLAQVSQILDAIKTADAASKDDFEERA